MKVPGSKGYRMWERRFEPGGARDRHKIFKTALTFRRDSCIILSARGNTLSVRETYPGVCVSQYFYPQIQKRIPSRFSRCQASFEVEGSKRPQVSALPERRVKKLRQTALTGYFRSSKGLRFFILRFFCLFIARLRYVPPTVPPVRCPTGGPERSSLLPSKPDICQRRGSVSATRCGSDSARPPCAHPVQSRSG